MVVAGVQADGRLIQHIQRTAQVRSQLCSQANALGFAAAERRHRAPKLHISQSHFVQKTQARGNLRQDVTGNLRTSTAPLQILEQFIRSEHGRLRKGIDGRLGIKLYPSRNRQRQADGTREGVQSRAVAFSTDFPLILEPFKPGLLDRLLCFATIHLRHVKRLSKPATCRAPPARGVVTEILWIQRRE